jgi:hypothetical protein
VTRNLIAIFTALMLLLATILSVGIAAAQGASNQELTPEQLGLVEDDTYRSPQFGNQVSWDRHWEADLVNMSTDREHFLDQLSIVSESGRFQAFYVQSSDELLSKYLERFVKYREGVYEDLKVVDQDKDEDTYTLHLSWTEGGRAVESILEFSFVNRDLGVIQIVELITYPENAVNAFDQAQSGIFIAERKPFQVIQEFPIPKD